MQKGTTQSDSVKKAISDGQKAVWAARSLEERVAIMSKVRIGRSNEEPQS